MSLLQGSSDSAVFHLDQNDILLETLLILHQISLNFLASVLISHLSSPHSLTPTTKASIIDSTGSFPLATLASILTERIKKARSVGKAPELNPSTEAVTAEAEAVDADVTRCLEMVGISRVFDVEGLWEVLSELSRSSNSATSDDLEAQEKEREKQRQSEPEIADSEDEGEDADEEAISPLPHIKKEDADDGIEIILIDTMTQIINELFSRKEKSDGTHHSIFLFLSTS